MVIDHPFDALLQRSSSEVEQEADGLLGEMKRSKCSEPTRVKDRLNPMHLPARRPFRPIDRR